MTRPSEKDVGGGKEATAVLDARDVRPARRPVEDRGSGHGLALEPGDDSAAAVPLAGHATEVRRYRMTGLTSVSFAF